MKIAKQLWQLNEKNFELTRGQRASLEETSMKWLLVMHLGPGEAGRSLWIWKDSLIYKFWASQGYCGCLKKKNDDDAQVVNTYMKTCSVNAIRGLRMKMSCYYLPFRDIKWQNSAIYSNMGGTEDTEWSKPDREKIKHHRFPPIQNINRLISENKQAERAMACRSQRGKQRAIRRSGCRGTNHDQTGWLLHLVHCRYLQLTYSIIQPNTDNRFWPSSSEASKF